MTQKEELAFIDECGAGTPWGCGLGVRFPAHILMGGREQRIHRAGAEPDDGHVMFHAECSPAVVEPDAVRRWSGTWTARHAAGQESDEAANK